MIEKEALEAELARELAALDLDDDNEDHDDIVVDTYRRLDLHDLLAHQDSVVPSCHSETWQAYAAATAQCDADLFAMLEASLQDVQQCTVPTPRSDAPTLVAGIDSPEPAATPDRHVSDDLQDDDGAILSCPDHCTPMCLGPCTTHCGPRCVHLQSLQAEEARAHAAAAAENDALMRQALAAVAQIAAAVRHDMSNAPPSSSMARVATPPRTSTEASSGTSKERASLQGNGQDVATARQNPIHWPLHTSSPEEASPPAPPPMSALVTQLTEARRRRPSTKEEDSREPGRPAAAGRMDALQQSQAELDERTRAIAAFAEQAEAARRQRELDIEAEKAAMVQKRMEEEAAAKAKAQRERDAALVAIAVVDMMAADREGLALRRYWQREELSRREGHERRRMAREDDLAHEWRRLERDAALRLEAHARAQAEARKQQELRQKQHEAAQRRQTVERKAMEAEEIHVRTVHAALEREHQAREARKKQQAEYDKQQAELRKLAEAKHALEEKQRMERLQREAERAEMARRHEEAELAAKQQLAMKKQQEDAIQQQLFLQKQQEEARQQQLLEIQKQQEKATQRRNVHFQQHVLPATVAFVRRRQLEGLSRQLMALEEQRSAMVEADEKAKLRKVHQMKWLRRWQAHAQRQRRQKQQKQQRQAQIQVTAASRLQRAWRVKAARRRVQHVAIAQHINSAARRLQRAWRRHIYERDRRWSAELQQQSENAAAKVQSAFRGFHIRKKLTSALAAVKFVDGDDFDYEEVDLDAFLGGAPELDDDDDNNAAPQPPAARPGWAAPQADDSWEEASPSAVHNTSPHAIVPRDLSPRGGNERDFIEASASGPHAPPTQTEASGASSLYKRMQNAIAHGRKGGKSKAAKSKDAKKINSSATNNQTSTVTTSVTWSSSGKKAKKVNVPSLVDRLRKTTAASR